MLAHGEGETVGVAVYWLVAAASVAAWAVYLEGARRLRRGPGGRRAVPSWRVMSLTGALAVALLAVSPPVDHLAHELFSAHMVQHLVLAFVVAPLLVLGRPVLVTGVVLGRGVRPPLPLRRWWARHRRSVWTALALAGAHAAGWYLWHLPGPYDLALHQPLVHALEHLTLVLTGVVLTWHAMVARPVLAAVGGALVSMLAVTPLAVMLVFAARPWYTSHLHSGHGLTPLEDQQIGGALMWFPGSLAYLGAVCIAIVRHLSEAGGPVAATAAQAVKVDETQPGQVDVDVARRRL